MKDFEDRLEEELRGADPVPAAVVAAARASFTWRTIDAELAALAYDSAEDELASVRGGAGARLLSFVAEGDGAGGVAVDVELEDRVLIGVVQPAGVALEVCRPEGSSGVVVDEHGRFSVEGVGRGPLSFRCTLDDGRVVSTEWVTV